GIHRRQGGGLVFSRWLDRAPWCGSDRGNEILFAAVPEFDLPGDGCLLLFPAHPDTVAQGGEVGVAAAVNRKLRTGLHTGVALPAHIRLDVEGPAVGGIDVHNVGRANIHTLSAAVATRHINEGRHVPLSPVSKADVGPISNVGSAGGRSLAGASAGAGRLLLVPFASATLFSRAAAGLKNICENLDHGIDPNTEPGTRRYRARNTYAQATLPVACTHAHSRPKVTLKTSETINK